MRRVSNAYHRCNRATWSNIPGTQRTVVQISLLSWATLVEKSPPEGVRSSHWPGDHPKACAGNGDITQVCHEQIHGRCSHNGSLGLAPSPDGLAGFFKRLQAPPQPRT